MHISNYNIRVNSLSVSKNDKLKVWFNFNIKIRSIT